jgi:capsular polysaccharide biosynthesis protein
MELDAYIKACLRWWFVALAALAIAIGGVWMYHNVRGTNKAQSTVVVLQSFLPGPGEFVTPRIGFDSVDESEKLADRVALRLDDGTQPDDLHISVEILSNLSLPNPSLLYGVSAEDKDKERAIKVTNLAVEEARKIFQEINTPNPRDVRAAYSAELDSARADLESARSDLAAFEQINNASELPKRIDDQLELVRQMRVSLVAADAGLASQAGGEAGLDSYRAALGREQTELDRLLSLKSEYDKLALELTTAENHLATLEQKIVDVIASRSLPLQADVNVLHEATIQSDLWWKVITYSLAIILALFISLTAIYLLGYFQRMPPTLEELEGAFSRPILARIPKAPR